MTSVVDLPSLRIDYGDEAGVLNKLFVTELLTPYSDGVEIPLLMSSAGNIELNVFDNKSIGFHFGDVNDTLSLMKTETDLLKISTTNSNVLKIESGLNDSNLLHMNDFTTYSDAGNAHVSVDTKVLHLHSGEVLCHSSMNVGNDFKVDGNAFLQNLHMSKTVGENQDEVTFAFVINDDKTLRLIKKQGTDANCVATFGFGDVANNSAITLSNYDGSLIDGVTNGGILDSLWRINTNNNVIYYGWEEGHGLKATENVGIGTSEPSERLQVAGLVRITDNVSDPSTSTHNLYLSSSNITGIDHIKFTDGTVFETPSKVPLSAFSNDLSFAELDESLPQWIDATPDTISLAGFSNDLAPWLDANQNEVPLSGFSNDNLPITFVGADAVPGSVSSTNFSLNKIPVSSNWRFSESNDKLYVEKFVNGSWAAASFFEIP